jgi:hypothetical protein
MHTQIRELAEALLNRRNGGGGELDGPVRNLLAAIAEEHTEFADIIYEYLPDIVTGTYDRRFELVEIKEGDLPRLTVATNRISLKMPKGSSQAMIDHYTSLAHTIADQVDNPHTVRGTFIGTGIRLRDVKNKTYGRFDENGQRKVPDVQPDEA